MNDWTLRLARPEDAELMPAIEFAASQAFAEDPDLINFDFDDTWESAELRQMIGKGHCLVAHVGDVMAGFIVTEPFRRELHVWEMDVHPRFQGKGIGASLMRACQVDAKNCGFSALTLTTFRDLLWNAPFYSRLGFVEINDLAAYLRLSAELEEEAQSGLSRERRCAMIHFLNQIG
jgi:ribosomal protein S18 acetylase RimI-like enzyme